MKKTLLISLAAVALGSMTACSNILEEEGVISPSAKLGTLSLSLEQDNTLNEETKATFNGTTVALTEDEIGSFNIVTKCGETPINDFTGLYSTLKGQSKRVAVGTYSFTATYGNMTAPFEWNTPCFYGSETAVVGVTEVVNANIKCSLSNSIVVINQDAFDTFNDLVTVEKIVAINSNVSETYGTDDLTSGVTLLDGASLKTETLYAKADITNAKIVMEGFVTLDNSKKFRVIAELKKGTGDTVGAQNKYVISYSLVTGDKGTLSISISVNGTVTIQEITKEVNPYN
ncbi:MAG: DUF4493 domain-containing protein [Parabacteroides sp.]|nr:DUF4493 domain-containing protein [Parabacteroides sp.]